jgi:hypothetical protein
MDRFIVSGRATSLISTRFEHEFEALVESFAVGQQVVEVALADDGAQ